MAFIKYSEDKEELNRILENNQKRFRELERRAVDVIQAVTNSGIKYKKSEEVVDVCKAIQEMQMEAEQRGKREGEQIGEQRGKQIGSHLCRGNQAHMIVIHTCLHCWVGYFHHIK